MSIEPVTTLGSDELISEVLSLHTWAIVGLSTNPARAAFGVAHLLQSKGKKIVPVHPAGDTVHGERGYTDLSHIPFHVDVVDIFVNAEAAGDVVDQALAIGAKAVWMQLGVINPDAAERAQAAGLKVVMNHCPAIEWPRLGPR